MKKRIEILILGFVVVLVVYFSAASYTTVFPPKGFGYLGNGMAIFDVTEEHYREVYAELKAPNAPEEGLWVPGHFESIEDFEEQMEVDITFD